MKGNLVHVFLNISEKTISFPFYKKCLGLLGYKVEFEDENNLGLNNGQTEIWLREAYGSDKSCKFDRRNVGINHLAFRVKRKEEVDTFYETFLKSNKISTLFDSPRIFPDFTDDYYAVYFEDPDGIKLEVTCYTFEFPIT